MLISMVSTIFLFNLEPFILPLFTGGASIAISPVFGIIWISGIGYAILKYRFLRWAPESLGSEILNNVDEAVWVLDPDYDPLYMNAPARVILGTPKGENHDSAKDSKRGMDSLLRSNPSITGELERLLAGEIRDLSCRLLLPKEKPEFLDARFSLIRDSFGDVLGITLVGRPVKDKITFKSLYTLTEKEMEVLRLALEGVKTDDISANLNISIRTVKYYLANIYTKLNVKNKIELFRMLKDYNLFSEQEADSVAFPLLMKKTKKRDGSAL